MSLPAVGLHSLAIAVPRTIRTNDHWRQHHPALVEAATNPSWMKVWSLPSDEAIDESSFAMELQHHVHDPFRGAVSRRILAPDETALSLELAAARQAIAVAGITASDIDMAIVGSFLPDGVGIGNAAFLARDLGLRCPAWNLESACSASLVALEVAASLVRAGSHRRILVVVSCTYSRVTPDTDALSWTIGDGAAAFIVGPVARDEGILSVKTLHTADGCGAMFHELDTSLGTQRIRMRAGKDAARVIRRTSIRVLRECCIGAAKLARVSLEDIDFFVFPTPTAWYTAFCARALGIPRAKTINTHRVFANSGPALMPTNLYYAALTRRIQPGSLVMLHTVGVAATASAAVVRWGHIALGAPEVPLTFDPLTGDVACPGPNRS
jgi:3-oxoacyl-[acyl-carrier-protein] synthase-3